MEWLTKRRLMSLIPLAYIILWFYTLFATIVPWFNITVNEATHEVLQLTLMQIIGAALFLTVGVIVLIFGLVLFLWLLVADN